MKQLVIQELRRNYKSFVTYCLVSLGFTWLYVSIFPSIEKQSEQYAKLLDAFPKGLMDAFGFDGTSINTVEKFLSTEMMSLLWPVLAILLIVSRAGATFSGSIENRTLGLELSLPLTRTKIYLSKLIGCLIVAFIFCLISLLGTIPICWVYSIDLQIKNILLTILLCVFLTLAMTSFSIAISAGANERGHLYFIVGAVLIVSYVFNIVSSLAPNFSWLRKISLFYYFSAPESLSRASIHLSSFVFFTVVAIASSFIGIIQFKKRDIPV